MTTYHLIFKKIYDIIYSESKGKDKNRASKKFEKPLDKPLPVWYNKDVRKRGTQNEKAHDMSANGSGRNNKNTFPHEFKVIGGM